MPRLSKEGPPAPPEGFVWSDEAARRLSITRRTLWNWRHTGKGPKGQRYHGRLVYAIAGIDAYKKAELDALVADDADRVHESRPPEPRIPRQHRAAA
ncbi:helix-turn-helix transcriptional regulator [Streptomyces chartreusis]|uniref:helix-turn-helix transcriptional regulator n=1 Tax=Streptomyces chartreusis TaxID=1969 RepID=UPI00123D31F9|nr:helix-turn-helix domain-containing protein [Streptomyces chartreusis]QEV66283.1 DNA-binding protein [Streptomyces chartreusis]GGW99232.1 hypothetical protein GCM10010321_12180 [Streptomyces chartreusis]